MKYPTFVCINYVPQAEERIQIWVGEKSVKDPQLYWAENAEELLVFLMGVYGWYPEGYEGGNHEALAEDIRAYLAAKEEAEELYRHNPQEYYRRLGICTDGGYDEKE